MLLQLRNLDGTITQAPRARSAVHPAAASPQKVRKSTSTNAIESTFATVRLRTKVTKGAGSSQAALAMAYKLCDTAQARWRRVDGPHLVALVRAGAVFIDGQLQERSHTDQSDPEDVAA